MFLLFPSFFFSLSFCSFLFSSPYQADDNARAAYINELATCDSLAELLQDQYGNYVIQRALAVSTYSQGSNLVKAMRPHLANMRNTSG
jgi:hypothetical protein